MLAVFMDWKPADRPLCISGLPFCIQDFDPESSFCKPEVTGVQYSRDV